MADEFRKSVEFGLKLSKRIYYGKDPSLKPPKPLPSMEKSLEDQEVAGPDHLPAAPMVYAVVSNPSIVDNPDIPSYQPYVHGRSKPPALIPLHMYGIEVEIDCHLDMAFVSLTGTWRVHCVSGSKKCPCRIAIPMGEQGSVLGFEVEASSGSYHTQLVNVEDAADLDGLAKAEYGSFLKPNIFTLKIPKVEGGSKLLVRARWSQKLLYHDDQYWLTLPFSFPVYVSPPGKFSKKEKILLNVNSGTSAEVLCKTATHPLKELTRQVGKFGLLYEANVYTWSQSDFEFSYTIPLSDIHGGVLLQSPPPNDFDQRDIFALYLLPGDSLNIGVFRKSIVFLVDISGSMKGAPIENVKKALLASLSKLNQDDFFNIIAFNGEISLFSSSMELATQEALRQASEWMSLKLVAGGDTDILLAVNKALEMVSNQSNLLSFIFLITDGAVENERDICKIVKDRCARKAGLPSLRISTFGIGSYCNHYFLRLLAQIGRGHYDVAYEADSVTSRLQRLFTMSLSVVLSNIEVDCFNHVKSLTLYPSTIQDLSSGCPVIVSGRCQGKLPETLTLHGILADMSNFTTDLKIQKAKDVPLDKVFAQRQIDVLTAEAWFTGTKEIEKQVTDISMQTGVPSEFTRMILVRADSEDQEQDSVMVQGKEVYNNAGLQKLVSSGKLIPFPSLGIGFGDLKKTAENLPSGVILKAPDATEIILKTATGCCKRVVDRVCCMCFIEAFSKLSDQCVITLSQICAALSCFECVECCFDLCGECS